MIRTLHVEVRRSYSTGRAMRERSRHRVGTSGFAYPHWRGAFHPGSVLGALPEGSRVALERRVARRRVDSVALGRAGASFGLFALPELASPRVATCDFVYVRLRGRRERCRGAYGGAALASWARWLRARLDEGLGVYVHFDDTDEADHVVRDAARSSRALEAR